MQERRESLGQAGTGEPKNGVREGERVAEPAQREAEESDALAREAALRLAREL